MNWSRLYHSARMCLITSTISRAKYICSLEKIVNKRKTENEFIVKKIMENSILKQLKSVGKDF